MIEKAAMNVVRERDGDETTLEWSVEQARYDEASSRRADRLDRKERYWGSLLSCLISYHGCQPRLTTFQPKSQPSDNRPAYVQ
jgi:hypothetical protein